MKIDSHQHFWKYDPVRYDWINEEMKTIRRDWMPEDLWPTLQENKIDGCITVQSEQTESENDFQLNNAASNQFIKAVVGWVDLQANNVEERLLHYSQFKKMKGFRHVLQGEPQRDLMLQPAFMNGISKLKRFNFTYDILIFPDQLKYIPEFVSAFPDQKFVIDHIAKPNIKEKQIDAWKKDIEIVAAYENVYCKISGMVTEADWQQWQDEDFFPYLDIIVNAFGMKRIMFGSDWPVCLVAGNYKKVKDITEKYFSSFSNEEQDMFFCKNAVGFYNLI
ncbi:MAG: amidohydrolase family protein [Ferruginibacter sp.]